MFFKVDGRIERRGGGRTPLFLVSLHGKPDRIKQGKQSRMIEERSTGKFLPSEILPASARDLGSLGTGWNFDWPLHATLFETFKLVAAELPDEILGLMSTGRSPGFVEVTLLENSPQNVGREKRFGRVCGNLLAFAARLSFRLGNDGVLLLRSKTRLIGHYERVYGFERIGQSHKLQLTPIASLRLIATYAGGIEDEASA